jgi:hypothetical protein
LENDDRPDAGASAPAGTTDARTVIARAVLLDALEALREHQPAIILVGAQAVYLHAGAGELAVAAYTFDGDLVVDPALLNDVPLIEQVTRAVGFVPSIRGNAVEPGVWVTRRRAGTEEVLVPVDLIVPEAFATSKGRRSVRIGAHDRFRRRVTEPLRNCELIGSHHFSQRCSQQCSQTRSRNGSRFDHHALEASARSGSSQQHSQQHSQTHITAL